MYIPCTKIFIIAKYLEVSLITTFFFPIFQLISPYNKNTKRDSWLWQISLINLIFIAHRFWIDWIHDLLMVAIFNFSFFLLKFYRHFWIYFYREMKVQLTLIGYWFEWIGFFIFIYWRFSDSGLTLVQVLRSKVAFKKERTKFVHI